MRSAETCLAIIRTRGERRLPIDDLYRQLFNPEFFLQAYSKISRNAGAMTAGANADTVDGIRWSGFRASSRPCASSGIDGHRFGARTFPKMERTFAQSGSRPGLTSFCRKRCG